MAYRKHSANVPRHEHILEIITDMVSDFLYYDRKGDEELPLEEIENAIKNGEVAVEEIVNTFKTELTIRIKEL